MEGLREMEWSSVEWRGIMAYQEQTTALVQRIQAGDQTAFRELVERYQSKIYSVIYGILGKRDETDNIAQEVFAKVYYNLKDFDLQSSLFIWIYRIAVNECYTHLQKMARSHAGREAPTQRHLVNQLLARIPNEDRTLLICREVEDCSEQELAEMTGLSLNAIRSKLSSARQKLLKAAERLSLLPFRQPSTERVAPLQP
jgi:RNA polymerase sigma-70 factor (ECF subfamily)